MSLPSDEPDLGFMRLALAEARAALATHDVPVGAVIVAADGRLLATGRNRREEARDPTAHAELLAIQGAARKLGHWQLVGATLYVTLEPCVMCAGALVQARVARLVYGCDDPKAGAVVSLYRIVEDPRLNHRLEVERGLLADEASALLKEFFAGLRARGTRYRPST